MLLFLKTNQILILFFASIICLIQGLYLLLIKGQSLAKKHTLIAMEIVVSVLLACDGLAYIFQGNTSLLGYWMVRITNFIVFFNTSLTILLFNLFLTLFFMETGKFKTLPKRIIAGFLIQGIALMLIILSQFSHWYYYFDENNVYHKGTFYIVSFILPYLAMMIQLSMVVTHRKLLSVDMMVAVFTFSLLPLIAGVAQYFNYGLSLINFALWISACIVFAMVISDQNRRLVNAASVEVFTGLPNTNGFMQAVGKIIARKDITEYNGFYFDIMRMGRINEKYGKDKGTEIICSYAHQIRKLIENDEIVARLGGNYFVALIKKANTQKFIKLLEDVPVDVEVVNGTDTIHIAAWAGIFEINDRHVTPNGIIGNCSTAIAYAKNEAHVPCMFLDEEMEERINRRRAIEEATEIGVKKGEFEPFYQPKVDSRTNKVIGAEALARWRNKGVLTGPEEFVSIMEKNRNICDLDFYMLGRVCKDISEWISMGLKPLPVSLNFSRRNLCDTTLADRVNDVVEEYHVPKECIQIEITETIDEYSLEELGAFVEGLHAHGFTVVIDDFGVGSSSINVLSKVNFDVLTIDRAFTGSNEEKARVLMRNIIHMADDMGMKTVVEGVEDEAKVEELKSMGCFNIQGFFYSKPLEKQDFVKYLVNPLIK